MAGAVASVAAGAMWTVKGGVILATGDQPPWLFEIGGLLFPLALIGLHARLDGEGGRRAHVGRFMARLAGAVALFAGVYGLAVGDPSEVVLGIAIALCSLATVVGLVLLGLSARAVGALPPRWRSLPFVMGVVAIPAMTILAGVLEAIHERLLELPIVAYGVAWIIVGVLLWSPRERSQLTSVAATP